MIMPNGYSQEDPIDAQVDNEYKTLILEADRLAQAENYPAAIELLQKLIDHPKLPAKDHAVMTLNKAILLGKAGRTEEALDAYDKAIDFKIPVIESYVREQKAVYLSEIGRPAESLVIYKFLLEQKDLKEEDRQRFQANIATLEQRLKQEQK